MEKIYYGNNIQINVSKNGIYKSQIDILGNHRQEMRERSNAKPRLSK